MKAVRLERGRGYDGDTQAGIRYLRRKSEKKKRVGESPLSVDALPARNHTREWKKEEEGNKGRKGKGRYGHYLPSSSALDAARHHQHLWRYNDMGVLHADYANGAWCWFEPS